MLVSNAGLESSCLSSMSRARPPNSSLNAIPVGRCVLCIYNCILLSIGSIQVPEPLQLRHPAYQFPYSLLIQTLGHGCSREHTRLLSSLPCIRLPRQPLLFLLLFVFNRCSSCSPAPPVLSLSSPSGTDCLTWLVRLAFSHILCSNEPSTPLLPPCIGATTRSPPPWLLQPLPPV